MPAIYQGTYFSQVLTLKDKTSGQPVDITEWTFRMHLRDNVGDLVHLLELTTENGGIVILDGINGQMYFSIEEDDTANLPAGSLVFDVLRTNNPPGPVRLFGGKVKVKTPVTRDA